MRAAQLDESCFARGSFSLLEGAQLRVPFALQLRGALRECLAVLRAGLGQLGGAPGLALFQDLTDLLVHLLGGGAMLRDERSALLGGAGARLGEGRFEGGGGFRDGRFERARGFGAGGLEGGVPVGAGLLRASLRSCFGFLQCFFFDLGATEHARGVTELAFGRHERSDLGVEGLLGPIQLVSRASQGAFVFEGAVRSVGFLALERETAFFGVEDVLVASAEGLTDGEDLLVLLVQRLA